MNPKLALAGKVTLIVFGLVLLSMFVFPGWNFFDSISSKKLDVDVSKEIVLNLADATVSVDEWSREYVEVTYDNMFGKKQQIDITCWNNEIVLNSKLDYSNFEHMDIKVPKGIVSIIANDIDAKGGIFKTIKANKCSLRNCGLAENYITEGKELALRDCKITGNGVIKNSDVEIRDTDMDNLVLASDNSMNATLRGLTGKTLKLDAKNANDLNIYLRDSDLEKFTVDYDGNKGSISILNAEIGKVQNNSKIKIQYKKNFIK